MIATSTLRKRSWAGCSSDLLTRPARSAGSPARGCGSGLPEARVFQAAVPITPPTSQHTAQNFFLEAVQATNVRAEDRIVELVKVDARRPPAGVRGRFAARRGRIVDRR